jgi:regulatory protein
MAPGRRTSAKLDRERLQGYALRQLAGRGHSVAELRSKLARRAERPELVEEVLGYLREYGFLDDRRFAESFSTARRDSEGFGQSRVLRDLRRKRIPREVAEEAVAAAYEGVDETALIEAFLERKYRHTDLARFLREPKNLNSAFRRLRHAGFGTSNTIRVLRRYSDRAEDLESAGGESESPEDV